MRSSAAWLGVAAVHDPDGRDADAFLEDLGGVAGEAARAHAAHVAPVRAHHREDEEPPVREERIDHGHVVEVGAAGVGVVVQEDVARVDVVAELLLHRLHRPADRHDVERVVLALGHRDELGVAVHEHAGEVLALVEDRGVGGAHQGDAHLAHDRGEGLAQDLQGDRVHRGGAHARASRSKRRLPWASIAPRQPGGTTVVAPNSSTMAGPCSSRPLGQPVAVPHRAVVRPALEPDRPALDQRARPAPRPARRAAQRPAWARGRRR